MPLSQLSIKNSKMAKETNFNEIVQTLQDAQQNKTLLETLATS